MQALKDFIKQFLHIGTSSVYDEEIDAFLPVAINMLDSNGIKPIPEDSEDFHMYKLCVAVAVVKLMDNEQKNTANYDKMYQTYVNILRTRRINK